MFATGWQSSNSTIGTFHANDVNSTSTDFTFTPATYVGNLTQTTDPNYEAGVTIISAVMLFLGLGMVIGRSKEGGE